MIKRTLLLLLGGFVVIVLLIGGLLLYPVIWPYSPDRPVRYSRTYSPGFQHEETVYFLVDYSVKRYRRPVWFIMPFERSHTVYHQAIYLYALELENNQLTQLDVLRDQFPFPPRVSVNWSRFIEAEEGIVLAYEAGTTSDFESQYDLRILDPDDGTLSPPRTQHNIVVESSPTHAQYFGEYRSPAADNPGFVPVSELRNLLEDLAEDDWGLPSSPVAQRAMGGLLSSVKCRLPGISPRTTVNIEREIRL